MTNVALNYPYRRFSSDVYAQHLADLLDEHQIPFEIVSEPEGSGSVILGAMNLPGVIVMVNAEDIKRISELEKSLTPRLHDPTGTTESEETVETHWLLFGYALGLAAAPIAIIVGLHLSTAKKRNRDFSVRFAYDTRARNHGRFILWFSLCVLLFSFGKSLVNGRQSLLDTFSLLTWAIGEAFH